MKKLFFVLIFVLMLPFVSARQGHMPLLAVKEKAGGYEGSVADLYLEINPGTGRVFMETYPLTKMDTQISTRFAKDVACDYLGIDCNEYDFFYTIKANSPIIGGPSAGAAITILTIAMLEDVELNQDITITGTINSGGLIGPVGSLLAKIDAASEIEIKTVLVPQGEGSIKEFNLTVNLTQYANKYDMKVVEVNDITSALYEFTGKYFKDITKNLSVNSEYSKTMGMLGDMLCNRSDFLNSQLAELKNKTKEITDKESLEIEKSALNKTQKGKKALEEERYYSAASYCFGANINYQYLIIKLENFTGFEAVKEEIEDFENKIDEINLITVTDLETYMVVKERLREARESLNQSQEGYNNKEEFSDDLAYAIERLYSAQSWSKFFSLPGKEFNLQKSNLEEGCIRKFVEAEERVQYSGLFYEKDLEELEKELELVKKDSEEENYAMCLFRAAKIKAEADVILGAIGVEEDQIDNIINSKLNIVKRIIIEAQEQGMFPIVGYSYYEYANSLKNESKYSALLYAEYALELSSLKLYFKEPIQEIGWSLERIKIRPGKEAPASVIFILGLIIGFLIAYLKRKPKKKR